MFSSVTVLKRHCSQASLVLEANILQPFRSPVGEPLNRDEKIRLTLNDFLTDELLQPPGPVELNIAYITITDLLDLALEMQKTRAQIPPGCARAKRRIKRRRRPVELARTT